MALQTKGFALSALPTAPKIPGNVGLVDVKEIYDGVKRGLESFEAARRAPAGMALADAQMAAETAQAPLGARMALAQTEGVEAQTPLKTALLASEASPEMQEAKRQALLNRSTKQPSGDVQLATSLAGAKLRLAEDPTDALAAQLVAALEPIVLAKSAVSAKNPQGAIDAGVAKTEATLATREGIAADTNQVRRDVATAGNETRTGIADANRATKETLTAEQLALKESLAKQGFSQSEINARINAQGRVDASKALASNKIYESQFQKNESIREQVAALGAIAQEADAYKASLLGSGPIVGSGPGLFVRGLFGDDTGRKLAASTAQAMRTAVESIRGLGAMSDTEFKAVMAQLPTTTDLPGAIETKMDFMNAVRPWLLARSDLFLSEMAKPGSSPMAAHETVRAAFPMPHIPGITLPQQPERVTPSTASPATTSGQTGTSQVTPEQKAAAQAWLDANPNDSRAAAVRAKAGLSIAPSPQSTPSADSAPSRSATGSSVNETSSSAPSQGAVVANGFNLDTPDGRIGYWVDAYKKEIDAGRMTPDRVRFRANQRRGGPTTDAEADEILKRLGITP